MNDDPPDVRVAAWLFTPRYSPMYLIGLAVVLAVEARFGFWWMLGAAFAAQAVLHWVEDPTDHDTTTTNRKV